MNTLLDTGLGIVATGMKRSPTHVSRIECWTGGVPKDGVITNMWNLHKHTRYKLEQAAKSKRKSKLMRPNEAEKPVFSSTKKKSKSK